MAEQSWFNASAAGNEAPGSFFANQGPLTPEVERRSGYELRPLTTGEVLDRTFFLYRNNFWLFVALSAVAATVSTVTSLARLGYIHFALHGNAVLAVRNRISIGITVVSVLLYLVVVSVTHAATVSAVVDIYLGDATSMAKSYRAVVGRWYRFLAIALWQAWSAMWLFVVLVIPAAVAIGFLSGRGSGAAPFGSIAGLSVLMFAGFAGGMVYGVIAYIRNSLAVPAEVMERLTIRAAMKRSKALAAGTKGRIFLLFLFLFALYLVAMAVESPIGFLLFRHAGEENLLLQSSLLFVNFVVASVIAPVGAIGLCLFYIDQRVRKEGFDIEYLMQRSGTTPSVPDEYGAVAGSFPAETL